MPSHLEGLLPKYNESIKVGRAVLCAPMKRPATTKFDYVGEAGGAQGTARPTFGWRQVRIETLGENERRIIYDDFGP